MAVNSLQINRSIRFCYRYRFVLYAALAIVGVQCLVAWSFLSIDSDERAAELRRQARRGEDSKYVQPAPAAAVAAPNNKPNDWMVSLSFFTLGTIAEYPNTRAARVFACQRQCSNCLINFLSVFY